MAWLAQSKDALQAGAAVVAILTAAWFVLRDLFRLLREWGANRLQDRARDGAGPTGSITSTDTVLVLWFERPGARHLVRTGEAEWFNAPKQLRVRVDRTPFELRGVRDLGSYFGS